MAERRYAPAADRNKEAIGAVLVEILDALARQDQKTRATLLEVASGTGQHAAHLADSLPGWTWQPTERATDLLPDINAWTADCRQVAPARVLDVLVPAWQTPWLASDPPVQAIFSANMIHIADWAACQGLFTGAAEIFGTDQSRRPASSALILYGPFKDQGQHTAPSNARFDESLRQRNPAWGVRDLSDLDGLARHVGLERTRRVPMPANNMILAFQRPADLWSNAIQS